MTRFVLFATLVACSSDKSLGVYNTPPSVSITSPSDGAAYDEGVSITFEAFVDDDFDADADLLVTWASDIQGDFEGNHAPEQGISQLVTANLQPGNHTVSCKVVDSQGEGASAHVLVTINDLPDAPTVDVVHPASGEDGLEGQSFEFVAMVSDTFDAPQDLVISFQSSLDDVFCEPSADAAGVASCDAALSVGDHLLTYTASNSGGFSTQATAYFTVVAGTEVDDDGDGWTETQGDCDDTDDTIYPGADEYYNGRDDDCDGVIDNGTEGCDDDGDGYAEVDGDCDDTDPLTYPGATETCDGQDNDCDETIDEDTTCYDDDGDGYTEIDGDCDDASAVTYPGAIEIEDGEDNDCDGIADEGTDAYDDDGDGWTENDGDCDDDDRTVSPGGLETCGDGVDNDCDGAADDENAYGCTYYYYDYDGDAYGSSSVAGRCLCSSSGYYTSSYDTDCYDYNASANPSATSYSTNDRGDGSFDYNCDGSQSKYYTSTYDCPSWSTSCTTGWNSSSSASCGHSGTYITSCTNYLGICNTSSSTRTQPCR